MMNEYLDSSFFILRWEIANKGLIIFFLFCFFPLNFYIRSGVVVLYLYIYIIIQGYYIDIRIDWIFVMSISINHKGFFCAFGEIFCFKEKSTQSTYYASLFNQSCVDINPIYIYIKIINIKFKISQVKNTFFSRKLNRFIINCKICHPWCNSSHEIRSSVAVNY